MVSIASQVKGLDNIASSFQTNGGLSEQAVDVLRQFVESGSVNMYHRKNFTRSNGNDYILEGAPSINYNEPRFIEDDIKSLVDIGLIT